MSPSFPPLLRDCNGDIEGIALTSASKLGGTANVMDDIITIQNEFSCLEYQPRTNQMRPLIGINVKSCIQVLKKIPVSTGQWEAVGTVWVDCVLSGKLCYHFVSIMAVVL